LPDSFNVSKKENAFVLDIEQLSDFSLKKTSKRCYGRGLRVLELSRSVMPLTWWRLSLG